jgi:hypothetical protein
MRILLYACLAIAAASLPLAVTGCGPKPNANKAGDHDHDHDHDHAAHGPHDGHVLELGEEEYHAEWTHEDDTGKVTVYLLDKDIKEAVPTAAEHVKISLKLGDSDMEYLLEPVGRTDGDMPTASQFELVDKPLATALVTEGVEATLEVEIGGKPYTAKIEHHAHDGHHH